MADVICDSMAPRCYLTDPQFMKTGGKTFRFAEPGHCTYVAWNLDDLHALAAGADIEPAVVTKWCYGWDYTARQMVAVIISQLCIAFLARVFEFIRCRYNRVIHADHLTLPALVEDYLLSPKLNAVLQCLQLGLSIITVIAYVTTTYALWASPGMTGFQGFLAAFFTCHYILLAFQANLRQEYFWSPNAMIDVASVVTIALQFHYPTILTFEFLRVTRVYIALTRLVENPWMKRFLNPVTVRIWLLLTKAFSLISGFAGFMFTIEVLGDIPGFHDKFIGPEGENVFSFFSSIYFVFVTISTVGYGDMSPSTMIGRAFATVFIVIGIVFFSTELVAIIAVVQEERLGKGSYEPSAKGAPHIMLTGEGVHDPATITNFCQEFFHPDHGWPIPQCGTLVGRELSKEVAEIFEGFKGMTVRQGSALLPRDLIRLRVSSARAAMIMADSRAADADAEDMGNMLRALSVLQHDPRSSVFLQLLNSDNRRQAVGLGLSQSSCLNIQVFKCSLIAQAVKLRGTSTLICNLIGSVSLGAYRIDANTPTYKKEFIHGAGCELYTLPISGAFTGWLFADAVAAVYALSKECDSGVVLCGLGYPQNDESTSNNDSHSDKDIRILLNPARRVIQGGEVAFWMAQDISELSELTSNAGIMKEKQLAVRLRKLMQPPAPKKKPGAGTPGRTPNSTPMAKGTRPRSGSQSQSHSNDGSTESEEFRLVRHKQSEAISVDGWKTATRLPRSTMLVAAKKGTGLPLSDYMDFQLKEDSRFIQLPFDTWSDQNRTHFVVIGCTNKLSLRYFLDPLREDWRQFVSKRPQASNANLKTWYTVEGRYVDCVPVVVVCDPGSEAEKLKSLSEYPDVYFVEGHPQDKETLVAAGVHRCRTVVVFAKPDKGQTDTNLLDRNGIFTMKFIQTTFGRNIRIVTELLSENAARFFDASTEETEARKEQLAFRERRLAAARRSQTSDLLDDIRRLLKPSGIPEMRPVTESVSATMHPQFASGELFLAGIVHTLFAQCYHNPLVVQMMIMLVGGDDADIGNRLPDIEPAGIRQVCAPSILFTKKDKPLYQDLFMHLLNLGLIPLGLYRVRGTMEYVFTSPPKNAELLESDLVFAIAGDTRALTRASRAGKKDTGKDGADLSSVPPRGSSASTMALPGQRGTDSSDSGAGVGGPLNMSVNKSVDSNGDSIGKISSLLRDNGSNHSSPALNKSSSGVQQLGQVVSPSIEMATPPPDAGNSSSATIKKPKPLQVSLTSPSMGTPDTQCSHQMKPPNAPGSHGPQMNTLYSRVGGSKTVVSAANHLGKALKADPDLKGRFSDVRRSVFEGKIVYAYGGPRALGPQQLAAIHSGMDITDREFDAYVRCVKEAACKAGVHGVEDTLESRLNDARSHIVRNSKPSSTRKHNISIDFPTVTSPAHPSIPDSLNPASSTLYDRIGGQWALRAAVAALYVRLTGDELFAPFFENIDMERQHTHLELVLTAAFGGPSAQTFDMKSSHAALRITNDVYDAFQAHLQKCLEQMSVSRADRDEVLQMSESLRGVVVSGSGNDQNFAAPHDQNETPATATTTETGTAFSLGDSAAAVVPIVSTAKTDNIDVPPAPVTPEPLAVATSSPAAAEHSLVSTGEPTDVSLDLSFSFASSPQQTRQRDPRRLSSVLRDVQAAIQAEDEGGLQTDDVDLSDVSDI